MRDPEVSEDSYTDSWRRFYLRSRSTSVFSALEVFYENALYKSTFDIDIDIVISQCLRLSVMHVCGHPPSRLSLACCCTICLCLFHLIFAMGLAPEIQESRAIARKPRDAACFSYTQWLFDCFLLELTKGQGLYSNGSHLSTKSRLNVKLKINK